MEKKCCFTGYRPEKLKYLYEKESAAYGQLYALLEKAILEAAEEGYRYFISGFAVGVDLMAAEIVLAQRRRYRLTLEAAIPCMNQPAGWPLEVKEEYYALLDQADHRVCLDEMGTRESFLKRNRYMVDASQRVIAVFDGKKGGTKHTVTYARRKKRELVVIDPQRMELLPREQTLF